MLTVDISKMKEASAYGACPYCGGEEPEIPGYERALLELEAYEESPEYFSKRVELMKNIPFNKWYEVDGVKYPYEANYQKMNDAYAQCHFGVSEWWNEIHKCPHCNKEYYTIHEH